MIENTDLISLTADIVVAHVGNNSISPADVPELISAVHGALVGLGEAPRPVEEELKPAVSVRSSVKPDYVVCLEDGKKLKMLKRYLRTNYDMSPEDYRAKWNLPRDYPMVAPNYAAQRQALAKKIGLGRKPANLEASTAKATPKTRPLTKTAPKTRSAKPVAKAPAPQSVEHAPQPRRRGRPKAAAKA